MELLENAVCPWCPGEHAIRRFCSLMQSRVADEIRPHIPPVGLEILSGMGMNEVLCNTGESKEVWISVSPFSL